MPIDYQIRHDRRLVAARGHGVFTHLDVVGYQNDVWSRPDVAGFDEVIDMTAVERIELPSADGVRQLAALSASMDDPEAPSKFAIVAPQDIAFGLGRMYEAHRAMSAQSAKEVGVFRTMTEALAWLGRTPADLA
jgi:hypothetical protein